MREALLIARTFFFVVIGWVIFRADNIHAAAQYLERMFTDFDYVGISNPTTLQTLFWIALLMIWEWIERRRKHALDFSGRGALRHAAARRAIYVIIILTCLTFHGQQGEFIYFRF